jgi:histone H3/H4
MSRGPSVGPARHPDVLKGDPPKPDAASRPKKPSAAFLAKRARKAERRKRLVARDIKRCQATTELMTSRSAFERIVRDILRETNSDLRLQPKAIDALRISTETAVAEAMARSNEVAVNVAGREGVLKRDFQFAVSTFPHFTPRGDPR